MSKKTSSEKITQENQKETLTRQYLDKFGTKRQKRKFLKDTARHDMAELKKDLKEKLKNLH